MLLSQGVSFTCTPFLNTVGVLDSYGSSFSLEISCGGLSIHTPNQLHPPPAVKIFLLHFPTCSLHWGVVQGDTCLLLFLPFSPSSSLLPIFLPFSPTPGCTWRSKP